MTMKIPTQHNTKKFRSVIYRNQISPMYVYVAKVIRKLDNIELYVGTYQTEEEANAAIRKTLSSDKEMHSPNKR